MSCAVDGHTCKHCAEGWRDEDHEIPCSHDHGCTEWHTCHCGDVIETDEESRVDYPFTVGRPGMYGGQCYRTLEAAQSNARYGSKLFGGQRIAVKDCGEGKETITHLYENGREIKETR